MSLPTSSLSQVCRAIADFVKTGMNASKHNISVMIGNPADAVPGQSDTDHRLNLFFYLIEPSGFFPGTNPGETWWLRLHCLMTGFGVAEGKISAGENDLRLLGEVIRLFHEKPVLANLQVEDEIFHLQVIFEQLTPDNLNHIWSTQGDVNYRPSVVYEMSLIPVIPAQRAVGSPLVGTVGHEIRADMGAQTAPFQGEVFSPPMPLTKVDISREDWAPAICLVYQGACVQSLAFARNDDALDDFQPAVWVAGEVGAEVILVWEKWTSSQGWQRQDATLAATATSQAINPDQVDEAETTVFDLPFDQQEKGQAVLYAERTYHRRIDKQQITVRSNPVLVIVY